MTNTNTPKLNQGIVLRFMKEALKQCSDHGNQSYNSLAVDTRNKLSEANFVTQLSRSPSGIRDFENDVHLIDLLAECYQKLFILGYIIPATDRQTATFDHRFFVITDMGYLWLTSSSDLIPEDQQGYLSALKVLVPTVDPVIEQYVHEALLTYDRGALFASAVMIGAASEKAVYLLMDALHGAVTNPTKKRSIEKVIEGRNLPTMYKRLEENIAHAKGQGMPYSVHEGTDHHLLSLEDAIRVQRNNAVHPQAGRVELETVRLALSAFPYACKKVYDLMDWFNHNSLP